MGSFSQALLIFFCLTHFGDSDFHYDECGNQIRETGKGIKTHREYNAFNQLSSFNNNGTLTHYDYDPLGRRIAKHTEHGKIDYIWDNDQLIGEYQHGEYTWYINLPNQFHPVALIKQGEVYHYHLDQLNTPRFVTNKNAEVVWQNHADVYGYEEPEASIKNSFTQPIRFQGQYFDEESGLHYNRYRYYSPKQQRFINQDPIGLVGGINHYQYAPNPVNWVDPFGLLCKEGQAKVKAALDANSAISPELKEKLIKLSQLPEDVSPYTADEMVNHINLGTAEQLVQQEKVDSNPEPKSLKECLERLDIARKNIIKDGYKAKYTDAELVQKSKDGSVGKSRFLVSFQPVNNNVDAKLAFQKPNGLVAMWATSFDMLENADSDPQIIADLLATGCDPSKEYVLHIVDRGEDLNSFGENTFVPTWSELEKPARKHLELKHQDALGNVLNSDYQKQYAAHMEEYWEKGLNEFNPKDQDEFIETLDDKVKEDKFAARHALRTEFGANSEFTGDGMTQCRHAGNDHGVVETLTLENDPPTIAEMKNVTTIHLTPIKG